MMKNLFQRLTFTFLFGLLISLTFLSCGNGDKEAYAAEIVKADALFEKEQYADAKVLYVKASSLKREEVYPKEQISKIDVLLAKKVEEKQQKINATKVEVTPKVVEAPKSKPFHVVVGSFAIQKNAINFQKTVSSSTVFKSREGNYLVSIQSFATINKAYNYLAVNKGNLSDPAWVYRIQ